MATSAFTFYDSGKLAVLNGSVKLGTDSLVMALATATYTPSAAHSTWADVSANEVADTDYAEKAITGAAVTIASGTVTFDSDDISFGTAVSITAKYAILVKGTAGSLVAGDAIIGYVDLNSGGGSVSSTNSTFSVNTPSGYFTAT